MKTNNLLLDTEFMDLPVELEITLEYQSELCDEESVFRSECWNFPEVLMDGNDITELATVPWIKERLIELISEQWDE